MKKMNYLRSVVLVALLLVVCAKTTSQERTFNQFGISFTCPSGWEIEEDAEDEGYYQINVEKSGLNSSGIVSIIVMENEMDLIDYISIYKESISSQSLYKQLKMDDVIVANYGQYAGVSSHYTANILRLPHEGRMYAFQSNGKLIYVLEQEAVEDKEKNAAGFQTIRESLKVE